MSRFAAIAAAIALLVSGIAIGALGTYLLLDRPGGRPPSEPNSFTGIMESRLELSEDQKEQVEVILRESRREADEIRRELRPRLEQHLARTRARFEALLTPEQRAKFERLYREDRRAERFFLENPPRPAPPRPNRPGPPPDEGPPR